MAQAYRIVVTPEARGQLEHLHAYIAAAADKETAFGFTDGIGDFIVGLNETPKRATPRAFTSDLEAFALQFHPLLRS